MTNLEIALQLLASGRCTPNDVDLERDIATASADYKNCKDTDTAAAYEINRRVEELKGMRRSEFLNELEAERLHLAGLSRAA